MLVHRSRIWRWNCGNRTTLTNPYDTDDESFQKGESRIRIFPLCPKSPIGTAGDWKPQPRS